jgi:hypothetical protein
MYISFVMAGHFPAIHVSTKDVDARDVREDALRALARA